MPAAVEIRASDADRERVAEILRGAAGAGLLTLDEADERLAAVYAARHVGDLAPLTADLPDGGRRLAPVDLAARRRAGTGARLHLLGYLAVVTLLVGIWVATGADYHFWPVWPALGMLPGVLGHFAAARRAGDPGSPVRRAIPGWDRSRAGWAPFACAGTPHRTSTSA